ncbi:MAG: hypothetical protein HY433_00250 [Candidatus Liptonbacteria bacterium]|nr:hypothetical protein [Candidatus Liptonbacteria bacterium]
MTLNEFFESLLGRINLKIDDNERKLIQEKQNALREKLREKLPLKDDFLTGSYARETIIKPKDDEEEFDVDFFIAFDNEDYGDKELSELHDLTANALKEIKDENKDLGVTEIDEKQRRSIGIRFGSNFQIDVVPAIEIEKDKLYKIFDKRTLKPVKSNPKLHGKLLTEANEKTGGKLVPVVKMLKAWKREKCDYVKSFHVELLAVKILGNGKMDSFSSGLGTFFAKASEYLKESCLKDPANSEMCVDGYLDDDGTRGALLTLLATENDLATRALELEKAGKEDAVKEWQKVFPDDGLETAEAVKSGGFYPGGGGVFVKKSFDDGRISSPRSWGE